VLLYERFRCEVIHGATVRIDTRRFFAEQGIYWNPWRSEYYGGFELIEFSAPFLLSLLERCIDRYRQRLLAKGKIPPDIFFRAFPDDVFSGLDFLDQTLLPEGGHVRLRIDR